jgi:methylated-DNA-[protein]-cysteine S-methyltransferase
MATTFARFPSPIGELILTASDAALKGVCFPLRRNRVTPEERPEWVQDDGRGPAGALLARVRRQLSEYFDGTRTSFDLPLDAEGSAFERRVWDLLRTIPYGATTSYGELARRLGDPRATRAVGAASSSVKWMSRAGSSLSSP